MQSLQRLCHVWFGWGHININVKDLDASVAFYQKLGFEVFLPSIPYLNLSMAERAGVPDEVCVAMGWPARTSGRACIMQIDAGFPKIDLTDSRMSPPAPTPTAP
jgi:hypothetical protein